MCYTIPASNQMSPNACIYVQVEARLRAFCDALCSGNKKEKR